MGYGRAIKGLAALGLVVLATSGSMAEFHPRVKLRKHYTITNVAELAPCTNLIEQFLRSDCVNENTRRAYDKALSYFIEFASRQTQQKSEAVRYSDITRSLLSDFRDARERMEAPASAELRLNAVKRWCAWVAERHYVPNPGMRLRGIKQPAAEFKGLTPDERTRLILICKSDKRPLSRFAPLLLLHTGLRNDEACKLRMAQIDKRREWINQVAGKSATPRDIPISHELRRELTEYCLHVEPGKELLGISNKTLWRIVNEQCVRARVRDEVSHPHALRHTFAYHTLSALEQAGIPLSRSLLRVRDVLGHADIKVTMRYLGQPPDDTDDILRAIV